jgi:hypothetical protein
VERGWGGSLLCRTWETTRALGLVRECMAALPEHGKPGAGLTVLRAVFLKVKMKPDAPEFVPKAVLLAATQGTAAPESSRPVEVQPLGEDQASGSKDVGSSSGASGEGKAETNSKPRSRRSLSSAVAGESPDTFPPTTLDAAEGIQCFGQHSQFSRGGIW